MKNKDIDLGVVQRERCKLFAFVAGLGDLGFVQKERCKLFAFVARLDSQRR